MAHDTPLLWLGIQGCGIFMVFFLIGSLVKFVLVGISRNVLDLSREAQRGKCNERSLLICENCMLC